MPNNSQNGFSYKEFMWAGGFEDTFIPQSRYGLRPLDEYELTQHYDQWREDLDRAASLGITSLRWGVPWYRVEPVQSKFDWDWIDSVLIYMVQDLHIQPIIDLMHYGTPLWLDKSFIDPNYPKYVAAYASKFAERYKDLVHFYTPHNEPTVNAEFCGQRGIWPPYLKGQRGYMRVLLPIAKGIQLSAQAIRAANPNAVLLAVEAMNWTEPVTPQAQEAASHRDQFNFICWDLVCGIVNESHPLYRFLLSTGVTSAEIYELRKRTVSYDILGVNFYPWSAQRIAVDKLNRVHTFPVECDGHLLGDVLRRCHSHTGLPLFVTETSAREDVAGRAAWMDATIMAVESVRSEGIPVIGYTWFPLMTMIDWDYRISKKPVTDYLLHLGLWDSHFDEGGSLVRKETTLVEKYRSYIRRGNPSLNLFH